MYPGAGAEAGGFATPESKALLERRLAEIAREIRDEALRRYYQADFRARLFKLFDRGGGRAYDRRPGERGFGARGFGGKAALRGWPERDGARNTVSKLAPNVSQSLANSPLLRPGKTSLSPRESLILLLLLNHPGLIERWAEAIAEIEFSSNEANGLRNALLDLAGAERLDRPSLRAAAEGAGFAPILQKLESLAAHGSHWYIKAEAAEADAEEVLRQALTLHHRARALHRELQSAELALVSESSEANLDRLKDIREQLLALGGTEAAVEGFGTLSGRAGGTL